MRVFIFISFFLLIFSSSGYYVYVRAMQSFQNSFASSKIVLIIYIFLFAAFLLGKTVEQFAIGDLSNSLIRIGSIALGIFLYSFLIIIFLDLLRMVHHFIPFFPDFITENYAKTKLILGISTLVISTTIFSVGYWNAASPKVNKLELTIDKPLSNELNIVAISDVHLGAHVRGKKLQRMIDEINAINPDVVLIGGDIIDDNIKVVKHAKLLEYFTQLNPKYGIYSCMGNHEYISRSYTDFEYFMENNINFIIDSTELIADQFYIIGRDDIQGQTFSGKPRKSIDELVKDVDFSKPIFLLDHQPYKLAEVAEYPIDFQFSGHTHNGQMWPFNYITGLMFEQDWGYLKKKNTHFYVSSGFGTAVVPIRVGNDSEIVHIRMTNSN